MRSLTFPLLDEMTPREVRASAERGNRMATKLRDPDAEQRFRFPHLIFLLAMRNGYTAAASKALELANGTFTPTEAMAYVRKVFAEGKAAIKDRTA